ncbi:hypothetical protein [Nostoc sp. DedQUE09]|uniref:hypothetical protein n=1 Tax=Nostoc sp. DedQUE09 TaxID=3075394 RepID=UPI002AD3C7CE|nr:hypothetical protein [Nostoc sp. DedQUE09]
MSHTPRRIFLEKSTGNAIASTCNAIASTGNAIASTCNAIVSAMLVVNPYLG